MGNDNIDNYFTEKLGVSRNYNLDNPMTLKEKTTREEVEVISMWLIWSFICSVKEGIKLNRWIVYLHVVQVFFV